jgi:hypothetical protein
VAPYCLIVSHLDGDGGDRNYENDFRACERYSLQFCYFSLSFPCMYNGTLADSNFKEDEIKCVDDGYKLYAMKVVWL